MSLSFGAASPLPLSAWAAGGYWPDVAASLVSSVGGNSFTPVASPPTVDPAMGGRAALSFDGATQYLTCAALAALVGPAKPLTVAARFRSVDTGTNVVWGAGNSGGSIEISGAWVSEFAALNTQTGSGGGTTSRTSDYRLRYNDHVVVWVYDPATGITQIYVDGLPTTVANASAVLPGGALNTFAVAARLAGTPQTPFGGFLKRFAIGAFVATPGQVATLTNAWGQLTDYTLPLSLSPNILWWGDSITQGDTGNNAGGYRVNLENYIISQRWSINSGGPNYQGQFPNNQHAAQGGADLATIQSLALASIAATPGGVKLGLLMGGTNNTVTNTPAQALTAYSTCLNAIYSAAVAPDPTVKIAVTTIPDQKSGNPGQTNVAPFNAGLPAIWSTFPPGALLIWDCYSVLGPWGATYFGTNPVHPNSAGYDQMFNAGLLPAIGSYLDSISPT